LEANEVAMKIANTIITMHIRAVVNGELRVT
jgi:hypothetical protein